MGRRQQAIVRRVQEFAVSRGRGIAYTWVPVSGAATTWPTRTPMHWVDAVWIDGVGRGDTIVRQPRPWTEEDLGAFTTAVERAKEVTLVSGHGYADRTVFGALISAREMFSRSFPEHPRIRLIALADGMDSRSAPYFSEGIEVVRTDGARLAYPAGRRSRRRGKPKAPTREDRMLERFFGGECGAQGTLWQEVVVGTARLDGLYVADGSDGLTFWAHDEAELGAIVAEHDVDVVEAKAVLNCDVIGQAIAGASMLSHVVPQHRLIRQTVVVGPKADPALEWVCAKRGIRVSRVSAD